MKGLANFYSEEEAGTNTACDSSLPQQCSLSLGERVPPMARERQQGELVCNLQ